MSAGASTAEHRREQTVAITGMACLFPGAPDLDAFWTNILEKVDATSEPPPEAWDSDTYYDPEFTDVDRTYCQRGGYLGELAAFDPLLHGIPPVAVGGEPDQWLALQVAHDALVDARAAQLPDEVRARTEIVLGKGTYLNGGNAIAVQRGLVIGQTIELIRRLHPEHDERYLEQLREEMQHVLPELGPETVPGLIPNIIVGRIANRLDLMGPAYTVDAACASSLVAVRHAFRDLLDGDCDLALAGGSQVWMPVATMNLFCRLGALSRRQRLRAFDKDADGTLLGEGIGIVVLKRTADAVRDGDRIYAVIRGVGVASDGRGVSVMAPRVEGEELALRRAYDSAGVEPGSIGLIEAHGTGTPVGDVVEVQALTRVFGERGPGLPRCALGSVKSMISHTIPAAGIAGLIKTAMALHQGVLPPTLHVEEPNPKLGLERTPFYINTETRPWIHAGAGPRRAGINAFGFGGINAHVVVEEFQGGVVRDHQPAWHSEVCVLEAESAPELAEQARRLLATLEAGPAFRLADLAYTLGSELGGVEQPRRLAIVASSLDDLAKKLRQALEKLEQPDCRRIKTMGGVYYEAEPLGREGKLAIVFPGEGAQYPNMLLDLCLHFPAARATFDRIDRLYADHPRGHRLSDWVFPRPAFSVQERRRNDARLMELDIAVESVLTANAAVYAVISRLLPQIDAMVGHSTGEHSAAMAAGALDVETDERLAAFCHGLHDSYADAAARHEVPGAMLLALGADTDTAERIAAQAGGGLYLAMDNCPHQTVLVGDPAAAARAKEIASAEALMCEQLPYDRAVHTPLFAPFAEDLRAIFARLPVRAPAAGLWSCTTAAPYPTDPERVRELLVEHWTSPVRFRETILALHDDGVRLFVEVGPRGNLTSFVDDILRERSFCAAAADVPRRPSTAQLARVAGMLAVHGVAIDLGCLFDHRRVEAVDWRAPSQARANGHARIPLSTSWPMVRLDDDALERLGDVEVGDGARAGEGAHAQEREHTNGHRHLEPPKPVPALAEVAAVAVPPDTDDELAAVVSGHLDVMERFLEANEQVMQAYLAGGAPVALEQARRPLVGSIVSWEPGVELVARRVLDPAEDRYLLHHTLGHGVSNSDPTLTGLALMPLAMSIEMLAEAATCLLPELTVVGLREVRAHRWLAVGEQPETLELTARRVDRDGANERVAVQLCTLGADGPQAPVVEGVVELSDGFAEPGQSMPPPAEGGRASRWRGNELYGEAMFHQPLWQGVESLDRLAPEGATATLRVLARDGLLHSTAEPNFVLDPVLLDAAGQVVGFWAAESLPDANVVFPFRLAALELFALPPTAGERLECRARIALEGEHLVRSQIDVVGGDGSCAMRLRGWEDKRFGVPARFRPLSRAGTLEKLSTAWEATHDPRVVCRQLDTRLGSDASLWKSVWACRVLSRRERAILAASTQPPRRQLEWLGARTAAKEAVAELLRSRHGIDLLPADIEILADDLGRPTVAIPDDEMLPSRPLVSLTHADGFAAAATALAPAGAAAGVGIDAEFLTERPEGFAGALLTDGERELLGALPGDAATEWLLRCWCAKEAAGKATGRGLVPGPRSAAIIELDREHEQIVVQADGRRMLVRTRREDRLIVATTAFGTDGGDE